MRHEHLPTANDSNPLPLTVVVVTLTVEMSGTLSTVIGELLTSVPSNKILMTAVPAVAKDV